MSLFPDPQVVIEPARDRTEPLIWIRRLAIFPSLALDSRPIREVRFRRGLNIIRTAKRPSGEERVIGHSVGKTLLTRLIRFCLGEAHFAIEDVRKRVAARLPECHAVAEVVLSGTPWTVFRPLRDSQSSASWAVNGGNWNVNSGSPDGAVPFADFVAQLEKSIVGPIPDLRLSHADHEIRWIDLLGWLARDHDCRYRVFNEWREPDADSGTGKLHREDASLLARLTMGLIDPSEQRLIEAHRRLLAETEAERATVNSLKRSIVASFQLLRDQLGLSDEDCTEQERLAGGLFATTAREVVDKKTKSLGRLSAELSSGTRLDQLYDLSIKAASEVAAKEEGLRRIDGLRHEAEMELKQRQTASSEIYHEQFSPARFCPARDCPLKPRENAPGQSDPEREVRIAELRERIASHDYEHAKLLEEIPALLKTCDDARRQYQSEQERVTSNVRGVSQQVGRWNLLVEQADQYERWLSELNQSQESLARLERKSEESLARLEVARRSQAANQRRLSDYFDWTLKTLLGPDASGAFAVDARGLQPIPGDTAAVHGAALSTLETVIGLDLACLTASICGLGYHARHLIHDSPREAELEEVLFNRIFQLVKQLEAASPNSDAPSFQYIVTTSSPVPKEFAAEPFTRVILDARVDAGLLLGVRL